MYFVYGLVDGLVILLVFAVFTGAFVLLEKHVDKLFK